MWKAWILNSNLGQLYDATDRWTEALKYGLRMVELQADSRDARDLIGNVYSSKPGL
jgi:hypothetical protein